MTLDELLAREAIRYTMASYTMGGDRMKVEDFVGAFTEDGVLESGGQTPEETTRCEGRDAIRRFITGFDDRPKAVNVEPPKFLRHHLSTSLIEMTGPESAKARTYFNVYTQVGPDHAGYYADVFRKVGDRWLIAERKVRMDWRSPISAFRSEA